LCPEVRAPGILRRVDGTQGPGAASGQTLGCAVVEAVNVFARGLAKVDASGAA
jgi:hypothetical protein